MSQPDNSWKGMVEGYQRLPKVKSYRGYTVGDVVTTAANRWEGWGGIVTDIRRKPDGSILVQWFNPDGMAVVFDAGGHFAKYKSFGGGRNWSYEEARDEIRNYLRARPHLRQDIAPENLRRVYGS
jgi:hypothetical protein